VDASELLHSNGTQVLRNEKLFLDAISVSKSVYGDAGHYHRDAGRDDQSQEYRLAESLQLYAEATRVASTYRYDTKDCLQLMKHMTTAGEENKQSSFVEVLSIRHKHCFSKLFQLFTIEVRAQAIAKIHSEEGVGDSASAVTEDQLIYFRKPRSKRLAKDSLLVVALSKCKIVVRELEMALPSHGDGRRTRQQKRARR